MFLVPKKNSEMRPIIKLEVPQHLGGEGKVQDGDPASHTQGPHQGQMGHIHRSSRTPIFMSRSRIKQEVPALHSQGDGLPFRALPFGLTTAPKEFTRVTATLASIVHRKGINLHLYLDNWLLRANSFQKCLTQTKDVLAEMTQLGFIVNPDKSELIPTQQFSFLGEDFDLALGIVRPTHEKVDKILTLCRILRKHPCQEARFLLKVLRVLNAVADVIPLGRVRMRPLQLNLLIQWSMSTQPLSYKVFLKQLLPGAPMLVE